MAKIEKIKLENFINPKMNRDICSKLHSGLIYLASHCNNAQSHDGQGFSKADVEAGKGLASSDPSKWSFKQAILAFNICYKYRAQLGNGGGLIMETLACPVSERTVDQNAPVVTATPWILCSNQAKHAPFQAFKKGTCFLLKLAGYEIFVYQQSTSGAYMGKVSIGRKTIFNGKVEDCKKVVMAEAEADQSSHRLNEEWLR